jgi:hypothetical protein
VGQQPGRAGQRAPAEICFHRSDLDEDTSFNDVAIGDAVTFELLEDDVSGARALRVKRHRRAR